ncbi:MAG: zf-HC2 domain-containing protein [Bdellovibrionota bacterium]
MITCKRATELLSRSADEPLSLREQLMLKLHLFICECCEQFRKQLDLLRSGAKSAADGDGPKLSQSTRARIQSEIEKHQG